MVKNKQKIPPPPQQSHQTTNKQPKSNKQENPSKIPQPTHQPTKPTNKPQSPKKEHKVSITLITLFWVWIGAVVLTHNVFTAK